MSRRDQGRNHHSSPPCPDVELVWRGKGRPRSERAPLDRAALPRVESHSARGGVQDPPCPGPAGKNQLLWADWLFATRALISECAGLIDLVYLDPPFATGSEFTLPTKLGGSDRNRDRQLPRRSAYSDSFAGLSPWLELMAELLPLVRGLLSEEGSLYVHVDYRTSASLRCLLDQIFGPGCLVNEIIWVYKTGGVPEKLGFSRKHDTILYYVRNPARAIWNPQKEKSYLRHRYGFSNVQIHRDEGGEYTWVNCRDVFDIPALRGNQPERVDFPTQKPEALLERILRASSNEGSLVADFTCGSGTTLAVATRLGRRWIGCDRSRHAIQLTRKRLLELESRPGFDLFTAGGAELRYWTDRVSDGTFCQDVLTLWGAEPMPAARQTRPQPRARAVPSEPPVDSLAGLHGMRDGCPVHVAARGFRVDRSLLAKLARLAAESGHRRVTVLGSDWSADLPRSLHAEGGERVTFTLIRVPRGPFLPEPHPRTSRFFELPEIHATLVRDSSGRTQVTLTGLSYHEDPPRSSLVEVEASTDYADYWALGVLSDCFQVLWSRGRTRRHRGLALTSDWLPAAAEPLALQVVDVFGTEVLSLIPTPTP